MYKRQAQRGIQTHIEQMLEIGIKLRTTARITIDYARNQLELIKLDRGVSSSTPVLPPDPILLPPGAQGHI